MAIARYTAAFVGLVGGLLLAAPAHADWTEFGGNPEHQLVSSEKLTAPLGVLWKHATNTVAGKVGNKGGMIISGDMIFFASKNRFYAADSSTGELKWRFPEGDTVDSKVPEVTATPTTNGEFVFVPTADGRMSAFKADEGQLIWQFQTGAAIHSSPTLVGDRLFFGSDDDFVYCINAKTGDLMWKSNDHLKPAPLSDDATGSPVYYNGVIYINSSDMKLFALEAESGKIIWRQRLTSPSLDISPVAFNGKVYLAAGSSIYQYRLRGGAYRVFPLAQWVENDISTTPIITEKFWYIGDRNGVFSAFTSAGKPALNGEGKPWKVKLEGRPVGTPLMTADTIYVTTDRGFIYGLNIQKGAISWTYRTEAPKGIDPLLSYYPIRAPMALTDGKLYILGDDGTLTCMTADAADDEGPVIVSPRPSRGSEVNGSPPLSIAAYLWDEGTGINPDTIEVLIDGGPVDADPSTAAERLTSSVRKGWTYDPVKRLIRYETPKSEPGQPELPLRDGRHKVAIQAADWRGNASSLEWSFVVNNSLPRGTVQARPTKSPKAGANANQPGGYPGMGGPGMGGPGMNGQQNGNRGRTGRGAFGNNQRGGMNSGGGGYGFGNRGGGAGGGVNRGGFGGVR